MITTSGLLKSLSPKKIIVSCLFSIVLLPFGFSLHVEAGNLLKVGASQVNITPPVGSIIGHSYGIGISEGVADELYAKIIVFEKDNVKSVFVAWDLISLPHSLIVDTRQLIEQRTGIPRSNIVMAATHAHAGPQLNPLFQEQVGGTAMEKSKAYTAKLPEMIAEGVATANGKLQPANVSFGTIEERSIAFNRRFLLKDGTVRMHAGRLNPDIIRAVGPMDPEVSVVYFESLDSEPLAILVNYALHVAVRGGNYFTADFPGVLSRRLAEVMGEEMVTIFTNGTSGNVAHIDVSRPEFFDRRQKSVRIGTVLASNVLKVLPSLEQIDVTSLQVRSEKVALPVPSVADHEVEWARDIISQYGKVNDLSFTDVVEAWRILDLEGTGGELEARHAFTTTVPLVEGGEAIQSEVQAITFGEELALVGFPGDAFVELGLAIKENSPFPYTIVSEQSGNGVLSYVPNRKAFSEGGYEVISARFSPGGGELLVDTSIRLLLDLYPERWSRE